MRIAATLLTLVGTAVLWSCAEEQYLDSKSSTCRAYGESTNLDAEPRYSADYLQRWATTDGCAVRLDVLTTVEGEDSCGGKAAGEIVMGVPLGRPTTKSSVVGYIRDPEGVFGHRATSAAFDEDAELPAAAADTGYRQDDAALWMRPGNELFIYLVYEDHIEAWPRADHSSACA